MVMAGITTMQLRAQMAVIDPTHITQNIINSSKEILQISTTSSHMLNNFQETVKIYEQSKAYYDRLLNVTASVKNSRQVAQCIHLVNDISRTYINGYNSILSSNQFSYDELSTIGYGYTYILERSGDRLGDLKKLISPSDLSLSDKERLDMISRLHRELSTDYRLINYYSDKYNAIAQQRQAVKYESELFEDLTGMTIDSLGD